MFVDQLLQLSIRPKECEMLCILIINLQYLLLYTVWYM